MTRGFFKAATIDDPTGEPMLTQGWLFTVRFADGLLFKVIVHRHHDDPDSGRWAVSDPVSGRRMCDYRRTRRGAIDTMHARCMFTRIAEAKAHGQRRTAA